MIDDSGHMKSTKSDPREWYREEELARDRARLKMTRARGGMRLAPVYVTAAFIAAGVLYMLLILAGAVEPAWSR